MRYNEDEIREQLNQASANVDTDQLWNDIKHHAPIRREKKWWPLPLMFLLGGLVVGGLSQFIFQTPCTSDEGRWTATIDSLSEANLRLSDKLNHSFAEVSHLKDELNQCILTNQSYPTYVYHTERNQKLHKKSNLISSPEISPNQISNQQKIEVSAYNSDIQSEKTIAQNIITIRDTITIEKTILVVPDLKIEEQKNAQTSQIKVLQKEKNWEYYFGFLLGTPKVSDRQTNAEGIVHQTSFTPHLSYGIELGAAKKISRRFSLGAILNYNNAIYRYNYSNKIIENINVVDTTDITTETNGSSSVVIGNTGGTKITETKGKIHGYQQLLSIVPMVSYQSVYHTKWQLHHHFGVGFDIIHRSRNIMPTYDEQSYIAQKVQGFSFNPYVRLGSRLDYLISKDLSASVLIQCAYRKEKYSFSNIAGTRNSLFPSLGLGLTFK